MMNPAEEGFGGQRGTDHNSAEELLAVVNASNEEIGAEKRGRIHAEKLLHRAVHVLVFDEQGRLLLQKRSAKKDLFPLHWECVGGHLGPGEGYVEAGIREVEEELGVRVEELMPMGKVGASAESGFEFVEVYRTVVFAALRPDPEEVVATEWVTLSQLYSEIRGEARSFSPIFLHTLRAVGLLGG